MKINRRQAMGTLFGIGGLASLGAAGLSAIRIYKNVETLSTSKLQEIYRRGYLKCGVNGDLKGFSERLIDSNSADKNLPLVPSDEKIYDFYTAAEGFEIDICRAIAITIFGEEINSKDGTSRILYLDLGTEPKSKVLPERFSAIKNGLVDVLIRNTSWTYTRDMKDDIDFCTPYFYDEQAFVVKKASDDSSSIEKIEDLAGATICVRAGTTTGDLVKSLNLNILSGLDTGTNSNSTAFAKYLTNECKAFTSEAAQIYAELSQLDAEDWNRHKLLYHSPPAYEEWAPVVSSNDSLWHDFVSLVVATLIDADDKGIRSQDVGVDITNESIQSWLNTVKNTIGQLQSTDFISEDFPKNIIGQIGNYGEIFQRHLLDTNNRPRSILDERGYNEIWHPEGKGRLNPRPL